MGRIDSEVEREFCEAIQIPCDQCGEIICNGFCGSLPLDKL